MRSRTVAVARVGYMCVACIALVLLAFDGVAQTPMAPADLRVDGKRTGVCVTDVWANLAACGWPGASNSGHPKNRSLVATGGRTIQTDGTVIDGERITGGLTISARNVIVRNSYISSSFGTGAAVNGTGVVKVLPGASVTIENCTLDGLNRTHAAIWFEGAQLIARGNDIFGVNDGVFVWDGDNFTLEANYLHGFTEETANGHVDGFQTEGASNGVIRRNTFDVAQSQTSAIAIWNGRDTSDNITVEGNLVAGGGFSIYAEDYSPSESNPDGGYAVTNIVFRNNVFSNIHYKCVGNWGIWYTRGAPTDGWRRIGNILLESGQNVDASNPIVDGVLCR